MNKNQQTALRAAASMISESTVAGIVMTMDDSGNVNVQVQGELMPVIFMERALQNHLSKGMTASEVGHDQKQ